MACTDGTESYRYERKFVIPENQANGLPTLLRASSFGFREVYAERFVNNIYFDTPFFRFFNENVQGQCERKKIRARWHGQQEVPHECRLEIKRKYGLVGRKEVYPLLPPEGGRFPFMPLERLPLPPQVHDEVFGTSMMLFNRYRRRYFLSADERFRATMDYDITYFPPRPDVVNVQSGNRDSTAVLELKYDCELDEEASAIASELPFDSSKKSKYVTGVYSIYSS